MTTPLRTVFLAALLCAACADADRAPATDDAATDTADSRSTAQAEEQSEWSETAQPIAVRRVRNTDFTGDGVPERLVVTAQGLTYDSLDIAVTIEGARGDTLWHEQWNSRLYFVYDGLEGKADSTVQRIVREHVDRLLAEDRFAMEGRLPSPLRNVDNDDVRREGIRYSLAELDYRRSRNLKPSDPIPVGAYAEIDAGSIDDARVEAVLADVRTRPTFMYFAGGEATYVIAWSERENAFVRIHSCC